MKLIDTKPIKIN